MLDRSNVDPPRFEFVVLADTHYVLPEKANTGEFETRRFQTARIGEALHLTRQLEPRFVLHLGDMVQEFPGTVDFPEALRQAKEQLDAAELVLHHAAGNHDVGDKPDPTTAAPWTTPEFLDHYHEHIGPSWYSFDQEPVHFVVLNTSIMNSELAAATAQWEWLEADLSAATQPQTVVCFHIPAYVMSPDEPSLGHYDNVAEPARSRLLALCEAHDVDVVFAGHSHFAFLNEHAGTRQYVLPSTSTTRPGFSELFSSAAPPAQGHNDAEKLGVFLVRVYDDGLRINFLRTQGPAATRVPGDGRRMLLPGTSGELVSSQLSVTLRHPLTNFAEVPITFPSTVRQPVRNDYPLLSLLEVGATAVRIPGAELADARQRDRHRVLRSHGFDTVATYLWEPGPSLPEQAAAVREDVDVFELQIPGDGPPSDQVLASIEEFARVAERPVSLCQVTLAQIRSVQMHRRQRFGYKPASLADLEARLAEADASVARVVCHLDDRDELWELIDGLGGEDPVTRRAVAVLVEVGLRGVAADAWLACEAMVALASVRGARIHIDTLMELDRTMDVRGGLLDRMCNPQASFRVLQSLNTVLHGRVVAGRITQVARTSYGVRAALADGGDLRLVIPGLERGGRAELDAELAGQRQRPTTRYDLASGWVGDGTAADIVPAPSDPSEPFVLVVPSASQRG